MNLPLVIAVSVLKIAVVMGVLLTCVAYTVLLERKVLGFIQLRYGPNRVGPWGLLQPLADALKLLFKEDFTPPGANKYLFVMAPVITGVARGTGVSPAVAAAPAPAPRPAAAPAAAESLAAGDVPLKAPMPGMIISYAVKVGDAVKTGDLICVLEAMKMQNSLPAPASGTVKAINFEPGASVAKDATILVIGK